MASKKAPAILLASLLILTSAKDARAGTKESQTRQLPLEVYDGYLLVVEGSAGDQQGLKFLLDTGATYTTIDRKWAGRLNRARRSDKVINLDKPVSLDRAILPTIAFGPEHATNVDVLVADLR